MGRYFIGIPIPADAKKKMKVQSWPALSRYKEEKLVPQHNWHLTLAFMGNLTDDQVGSLQALMSTWVWPKAFKVSVRNFGGFPNIDECKVVWLGVEKGKDEITELANNLRRQLDSLGIKYDNKDFVPHITVARMRSPKNASRLLHSGKMKQEISFMAEEMCLYDSEKNKSPYDIIETVSLEQ